MSKHEPDRGSAMANAGLCGLLSGTGLLAITLATWSNDIFWPFTFLGCWINPLSGLWAGFALGLAFPSWFDRAPRKKRGVADKATSSRPIR